MRSNEIIMPEVNRLDYRLQPEWRGAVLIHGVSVRLVGGPGVIAVRVNPFAYVGTSFKESVHGIASSVETFFRNHEASLPSKLNQTCVNGEPNNSSGPSFAPGVIRSRDELTKRKRFPFAIGFHDTSLEQAIPRALWGVYPMPELNESTATWQDGMEVRET